jgi:hypothetical protein
MSAAADAARRLIERTGAQPVISLYFNLDPEEFGTAPARASQARSLLDDAKRIAEPLALDHAARGALEQDLSRVEAELGSDDLPVSGAGALAIFSSSGGDLFETVRLAEPTPSCVFVEPVAHVEPLVTAPAVGRWCAVLVFSDRAEVREGDGRAVTRRASSEDYVRGAGQTGDGQTHSREQDIEGHLRQVAGELHRRWQSDHFELLALGGPAEAVSRLRPLLHNDLAAILADRELSLDPSAASDGDVVAAVAELSDERHAAAREAALAELRSRLAGDERVASGPSEVQAALVQRRVQTLLISRDYDDHDNRREAAVQTAVLQDAEVIAFAEPVDELPAARPIAALLRY